MKTLTKIAIFGFTGILSAVRDLLFACRRRTRVIGMIALAAALPMSTSAQAYSIIAAGPLEECDTVSHVCQPTSGTISGSADLIADLSITFEGFGQGWTFQNLVPLQQSLAGSIPHVAVAARRTELITGQPVMGTFALAMDDTFHLDNQHGEELWGQIAYTSDPGTAHGFTIGPAALPWTSCDPCGPVNGNANGQLLLDFSMQMILRGHLYSFDHVDDFDITSPRGGGLQVLSLSAYASNDPVHLTIIDDRFFLDNGHGEGLRGALAFVPEPSLPELLCAGFAALMLARRRSRHSASAPNLNAARRDS